MMQMIISRNLTKAGEGEDPLGGLPFLAEEEAVSWTMKRHRERKEALVPILECEGTMNLSKQI
jgi:hypothetical protein